MTLYVFAAFALLAVRAGYLRWSRRRWPTWMTGFAVTGMVLAGGCEAAHRWQERPLEDVSAMLAGRSVEVTCQRASETFLDASAKHGFVPFDPDGATNQVWLSWDTCRDLRGYRGDPADPTLDQVIAVHVLTHEAMHVAGHLNEAEAECKAVQRNARTAIALGAEPADAHALAVRYWQEVYPMLHSEYRTSECAAGGDQDDDLSTSPWNLMDQPADPGVRG